MSRSITQLNLAYLYPRSMNIYGDRGNVLALVKRCEWRGIQLLVDEIEVGEDLKPSRYDLVFAGGGQDRHQLRIADDLQAKKKKIHEMVEQGSVFLLVCGSYQLFGHYFKTAEGVELLGISVLDVYTVASNRRKIGNVVVNVETQNFASLQLSTLVGFENHSGNTWINIPPDKGGPARSSLGGYGENSIDSDRLASVCPPWENHTISLGKIIKGFGNNGEDKTEGARYKNCFGTYLHGSLLPKNPHFADYLIQLALVNKYKKEIQLEPLDDALELQAHEFILQNRK